MKLAPSLTEVKQIFGNVNASGSSPDALIRVLNDLTGRFNASAVEDTLWFSSPTNALRLVMPHRAPR